MIRSLFSGYQRLCMYFFSNSMLGFKPILLSKTDADVKSIPSAISSRASSNNSPSLPAFSSFSFTLRISSAVTVIPSFSKAAHTSSGVSSSRSLLTIQMPRQPSGFSVFLRSSVKFSFPVLPDIFCKLFTLIYTR